MIRLLACSLLIGAVLAGSPRVSAEPLPVGLDRYGAACVRAGGGVNRTIDAAGSGTLNCLWSARGEGTQCHVGAFQVTDCMIRCRSEACYAANPVKDRPAWPLDGGPTLRKVQVPANVQEQSTGTLAPVN